MCGICGVARFDERPIDRRAIEACCSALRHRGPDHVGVWVEGGRESSALNVGMGAARLAVLDPRAEAHQPLHRDGRFHLVYNGEVYNYRELRDELIAAGESFATEGDTEVVLAACARWGVEVLERLDGMWALAFYDSRERRGFLARDPIGIKPLFFAATGDQLVFASELRALRCFDGWDRRIDERAAVEHLAFGYIADPATIHVGARRLAPGHRLAFGPSRADAPRRFAGDRVASELDLPDGRDEGRAELRRRIGDAVARQRVADVPVGAFLSGGLDSSIVAHHLAEASPNPIHTFCVGYEGQRTYDERRYAKLVADRIASDHEEVVLTEREVLDAIPGLLDHLGEPVGDSSIIPTSLVSRVARKFVTVALSGDGGDELFGGYWRYTAHATLEGYLKVPTFARRMLIEPGLRALGSSRSSSVGNRVRQWRKLLRAHERDPLARHVAWSRILAPEAESLLLDRDALEAIEREKLDIARRVSDLLPHDDPLNRVLAFDLRHQLPADMLHKADLASMMHSLEVRVPLLDRTVVEFASSLPSRCKIDRGLRKRILVDAYRGVLPDEILDRSKQGFEVPLGEYLRGPMRAMFHDVVARSTVESFGFLRFAAVESMVQEHLHRRADHADVLWALLSLCWRRGNAAVD